MIIRSQDKTVIVNFNMQSEIYLSEGMGGFGIETNEFMLGEYSTEEKAIKVLDMIEKQHLDYCCNYHSQSGVFQMPQESEV